GIGFVHWSVHFGPVVGILCQLDFHYLFLLCSCFMDGRQFHIPFGQAVRSLSFYSAEPRALLSGRPSGAHHHDEPKPLGGEGPTAVRTRLSGKTESRTGNPPTDRKTRPAPQTPIAQAAGSPAASTGPNEGNRCQKL